MNKFATIFLAMVLISAPYANARVDARFIIKNEGGRQIYMITPDRKIIFGNVVAGEKIIFDASASNSAYKIDRYYWDFDGDGKYDDITTQPTTWHVYEKPGIYNATLMAVATSAPPYGDGDVVKHVIKVVNKLEKPVAAFNIKKCENGSYEFNATISYDPDGYIKTYGWDFDGDGKYDFYSMKPVAYHVYMKNGYHETKLEVIDYDLMKNDLIRVIEIKDKNGDIDEWNGKIFVKNKMNEPVKLNITINNYYAYNISLNKNEIKSLKNVFLNDGLNEIHISYSSEKNNVDKIILFNFSKDIEIVVTGDTAYIENKKQPGYEITLLLISILILTYFKKLKKIRGKD